MLRSITYFAAACASVLLSTKVLAHPSAESDTTQPSTAAACQEAASTTRDGWRLVWCDEFEGERIDKSKWNFQIGDGADTSSGPGWGNLELEYYTARSTNAHAGNGVLTISAHHDGPHFANGLARSYPYSSARLNTKNKGDWTYGRIEVRARMPKGQGVWPAIWMMPTDSIYGGWAASGEIDIAETKGQDPNSVWGTLHYGEQWNQNKLSGCIANIAGGLNDDFHTYAVEWEENGIRWYVDNVMFAAQQPRTSPTAVQCHGSTLNPETNYHQGWYSSGGDKPAPFNERFHLILNVAVGGKFAGNPDASTSFPAQMLVDYVRVYQRDAKQ